MKADHMNCLHGGWLNRCSSLVRRCRSLAGLLVVIAGVTTVNAGCGLLGDKPKPPAPTAGNKPPATTPPGPTIPIPAIFSKPRSPNEIKAEIEAYLTQLTCCRVQIAHMKDGIVMLTGRVGSQEQKQNIIQTIKGVKGVVEVETDFVMIPPSFQEVISLLRGFQATTLESSINIRPSKGCDETYYRNEPLVLNIMAERPLRYVYVDYYAADQTSVAHLFPNPQQTNNLVGAATSLQLDGWSFDEPFGMELVTVISSSMPLIYPNRLKPEEASRYLPELRNALISRPPNAFVVAYSCLIMTQATAPQPTAVKTESKEPTPKPAQARTIEAPQEARLSPASEAPQDARLTPPSEAPQEAKPSPPSVTFLDLDDFDKSLSLVLKKQQPEVKVSFHAPADVNNIPERLKKWLAAVQGEGGKLEVVADPEYKGTVTRGPLAAALSVLQLIPMLYNMIKDKILYSPAEEYDATVYYIEGKGTITKVVFKRKE